MNLQEIFNSLIAPDDDTDSSITLEFDDKKEYLSLRTMLIRKMSAYKIMCADLGLTEYENKYVQCSFDAETVTGTFKIEDEANSKRIKRSYRVKTL